MSWTSLCTVISCLTWPNDTYFCHKQNTVTSWNFHIKQLDTQMEQLLSKSPQFAAKSKPLGNLPEYQPLLPPIFLFLTLVTNWAQVHTFNSAFYFCQAIDTHIEERVRHMNQWAWEITIAGCSLTHILPGTMWKGVFTALSGVWAVGASSTWQLFEWLTELKWEDTGGYLYVAWMLISLLVCGESNTWADWPDSICSHDPLVCSCILYIPATLAEKISMAVT